MLTTKNQIKREFRTGGVDGEHALYRVGNYGLSLVNGKMLHSYPYAWEAAVLEFQGDKYRLTYSTPLTNDVEVFYTEEEANAFIERAFAWMEEQKNAL